jgi:alcohol dehydrogenase
VKKADITAKLDLPTSWRHGTGLSAEIASYVKELQCRRPLILTDKILTGSGLLGPITASLESAGLPAVVCAGVNREPTVEMFDALVEEIELNNHDLIIAVGGGSVLDVSKGLAIIHSFGGHIRDYAGHDKVPAVPAIKIIAVPTTAGTGSEISDGVVLIDEERQSKFLVLSKKICPTIALTDPLLTLSMPPKVTACSGTDALVHAVESYLSRNANIATELFSLRAVGLLSANLKKAYDNGRDLEARESMQLGATLAMMAGMNVYLGLCHAMAMPLCGLYDIPHGQVCGMLLPHVLEYNAEVAEERVHDILAAILPNEKNTSLTKGLERIHDMLEGIGLAAGLAGFGYNPTHLPTIVRETLGSAQCPTNPRSPRGEDIESIVKKMI